MKWKCLAVGVHAAGVFKIWFRPDGPRPRDPDWVIHIRVDGLFTPWAGADTLEAAKWLVERTGRKELKLAVAQIRRVRQVSSRYPSRHPEGNSV